MIHESKLQNRFAITKNIVVVNKKDSGVAELHGTVPGTLRQKHTLVEKLPWDSWKHPFVMAVLFESTALVHI